jgi:hypothetical protein
MDLATLSTATIGTSPTRVWAAGDAFDKRLLIVQNSGAATVFLGDETVAASGETPALPLAPGATVTLPRSVPLWGIVEATSGTVTLLPLRD